jgi:hypothetical protein
MGVSARNPRLSGATASGRTSPFQGTVGEGPESAPSCPGAPGAAKRRVLPLFGHPAEHVDWRTSPEAERYGFDRQMRKADLSIKSGEASRTYFTQTPAAASHGPAAFFGHRCRDRDPDRDSEIPIRTWHIRTRSQAPHPNPMAVRKEFPQAQKAFRDEGLRSGRAPKPNVHAARTWWVQSRRK